MGAHVTLEGAEDVRPRGEPFEDGEGGRVADVPGCLEGRVEEAGYAGECWVDCVLAERGLGVGMGVVSEGGTGRRTVSKAVYEQRERYLAVCAVRV